MSLLPHTRARLLRLTLGGALMAPASVSAMRNAPFLREALKWEPLLYGVWSIGLLGLLLAAGELLGGLLPGAAPPVRPRPVVRRWPVDALLSSLLVGLGLAVMGAWATIANPEQILSGYDYNTYALNAMAVTTGEWRLYNPDKHVFHARVVAWLFGRGDQQAGMVDLSVTCTALLPALTYLLARRAGGRTAAVLAALLVLACPLIWPFATQTTTYPLFYALITAASTALLWLLQRPSLPAALLFGLLGGAAAATQEKAVIHLAPLLGLVSLLGLPSFIRALRARPWRTIGRLSIVVALALGLVVGVLRGTAPPMEYTPFVSLLTNQREEVHLHVPYTWAEVKTPDVNDPAGLRAYLPAALWDGEIESWVAAVRTPADSLSLRKRRSRDGREPPWWVVPNTSIAPVELRLQSNLREVRQIYGPLPEAGAALVLFGALGLLTLGAGRARWAAGLTGVLLSGLAPLTLRFGIHYYPQLVPIVGTLAMAGLDAIVCWLLPGGSRWLGRVPLVWIGLAYALAWWSGDRAAWERPALAFPPPSAIPHEDPGSYALNLKRVGEWLAASPHPGPIIDCVPGSMLLVLPFDPRFSHILGDGACLEGLRTPTPGQWLVASGHLEYRGPNTPDPRALVKGGDWVVVWGWDGRSGAVPPEWPRFSRPAVIVLERTTETPTAP